MKEIVLNKTLPVINMNFEEVKASLIETTEKYKGIIVTEDGLMDCKATQKDLAKIRNDIDSYRKAVKKEMEKPIKEFEGQCKELISLVEDAEQPIKEGILLFDNKRREEKRAKALEIINDCIQSFMLEEKYASRLTVIDKYLVLSCSVKSVREDVEQRANALKQEQNMEKAKIEMIKGSIAATLEEVNKTINTPLIADSFYRFIDYGWDMPRIIKEINNRADLIREAEKPKEDSKIIEEVKPLAPIEEKIPEVNITPIEEKLFFVDIKVIHDKDNIEKLSQFLKSNGYEYIVNSKGRYIK